VASRLYTEIMWSFPNQTRMILVNLRFAKNPAFYLNTTSATACKKRWFHLECTTSLFSRVTVLVWPAPTNKFRHTTNKPRHRPCYLLGHDETQESTGYTRESPQSEDPTLSSLPDRTHKGPIHRGLQLRPTLPHKLHSEQPGSLPWLYTHH
jgi:hypothetical protein